MPPCSHRRSRGSGLRARLGPPTVRRVWGNGAERRLRRAGGPKASPLVLCAVSLSCLLSWPTSAAAQGDGVYGRLDADLVLEAALGGGAAFEPALQGATALDLRARYLDMAGLVVGVEWRPTGASRAIVGADLRPLFLARFLLGASLQDRYWDLLLDSIGIDLGVAITPFDQRAGVALAVGFGLDIPLLFFGEGVSGLALRLFGRHVSARPSDRYGPVDGVDDWVVGAMIVVRGQARTGLPAWEPRRYELR